MVRKIIAPVDTCDCSLQSSTKRIQASKLNRSKMLMRNAAYPQKLLPQQTRAQATLTNLLNIRFSQQPKTAPATRELWTFRCLLSSDKLIQLWMWVSYETRGAQAESCDSHAAKQRTAGSICCRFERTEKILETHAGKRWTLPEIAPQQQQKLASHLSLSLARAGILKNAAKSHLYTPHPLAS